MFSLITTLLGVSVIGIVRPIVSSIYHFSRFIQPWVPVPTFDFNGKILIVVDTTYTDTGENLNKNIDNCKSIFSRMNVSTVHVKDGEKVSDIVECNPTDYVVVLREKVTDDSNWLSILLILLLRSHVSLIPTTGVVSIPTRFGSYETDIRSRELTERYDIKIFDTDWAVLCSSTALFPYTIRTSCREMFYERYKVLCFPFI